VGEDFYYPIYLCGLALKHGVIITHNCLYSRRYPHIDSVDTNQSVCHFRTFRLVIFALLLISKMSFLFMAAAISGIGIKPLVDVGSTSMKPPSPLIMKHIVTFFAGGTGNTSDAVRVLCLDGWSDTGGGVFGCFLVVLAENLLVARHWIRSSVLSSLRPTFHRTILAF